MLNYKEPLLEQPQQEQEEQPIFFGCGDLIVPGPAGQPQSIMHEWSKYQNHRGGRNELLHVEQPKGWIGAYSPKRRKVRTGPFLLEKMSEEEASSLDEHYWGAWTMSGKLSWYLALCEGLFCEEGGWVPYYETHEFDMKIHFTV